MLTGANGQTICFRQSRDLNYHSLVKMRGVAQCRDTVCGSANDTDRQFCVKAGGQSQVCPANALAFEQGGANPVAGATQKNFLNQWTAYLITNNASNSPVASLRLGINRPCGNQAQDYVARPLEISPLYKDKLNSQCTYLDSDGNMEHTLFYSTNFNDSELDVYNLNNLTATIKGAVADYSDLDLLLNNYTLFYKPYALWTAACQAVHSTEELAKQGLSAGGL